MANNRWLKWVRQKPNFAKALPSVKRPRFRPRLERLEDLITPTITLSGLTLTPSGPINEGQIATLTGNYTATNVTGQRRLTVTSSVSVLGHRHQRHCRRWAPPSRSRSRSRTTTHPRQRRSPSARPSWTPARRCWPVRTGRVTGPSMCHYLERIGCQRRRHQPGKCGRRRPVS